MIDKKQLTPEMQRALDLVLERCADRGVIMYPYFGIRNPWDQAKYWRQSRSASEIEKTAKFLFDCGATFIAKCLLEVGPQNGRWATNSLPGASWHQYGEAVDCVLMIGDKMEWNAEHQGYKVYVEEIKRASLKAGRDFGDTVHMQLRQQEIPHLYDWKQINDLMLEKYGDLKWSLTR